MKPEADIPQAAPYIEPVDRNAWDTEMPLKAVDVVHAILFVVVVGFLFAQV